MQNETQDGVSSFKTSIFDNIVLPSQTFNCSEQDGVISRMLSISIQERREEKNQGRHIMGTISSKEQNEKDRSRATK
jgi:hypothetical protein